MVTQSTFQRRPGEGALFFIKHAAADVALWGGNLMLTDGTEARVDAKVITPPGKAPHWECTVRQIGQPGEVWPTLAEFKMKAFGGIANRAQDVKIGAIGKCKAYVRQAGTGQFIKLQMLDAPRPTSSAP